MSSRLITLANFEPSFKRLAVICRHLTSESTVTSNHNRTDLNNNNNASPAHLARVADVLSHSLPKFFSTPHPHHLYTKDVVLIDNIRGLKVEGIKKYQTHVILVRVYHNLRHNFPKLELLNLVKNHEESCIKIRWRIEARQGIFKSVFFVWKLHKSNQWKDGISTMYVNKDGKIYCHVCDNIDVENNEIKDKKAIKTPLINRGLNVNVKRSDVT